MLRCAHCAADEPEGDSSVILWRVKFPDGERSRKPLGNGSDLASKAVVGDDDETEQIGEWALCDPCGVKYQNEFLERANPTGLLQDICSRCGAAIDAKGVDWVGSLSLAPNESGGTCESDDALCLPCAALAREFLKEDSGLG